MRDLPQQESPSVRPCTVEDLPWILSLAHRRYTKTPDPGTSLTWLAGIIKSPTALAMRSLNAFCVTIMHVPPWWPDEPEAHVAVLVAAKGHHWDTVRLLRESLAWSRGKGCVRWYVSSETDYDFRALAKRVGAKPDVVKYKVDLHG